MRQLLVITVGVSLVLGATPRTTVAQGSTGQPVTRIYSDADGETHIEVVMMDVGRSNGFSGADTAHFYRYAADMNADWHPTPRRQFIITLAGPGYEIEASDGSVAQLLPGSVLLLEDIDLTCRGHRARSLGGETLVMFVPIN